VDDKKYHVIDKVAIEELYNTIIQLGDRVKRIEKVMKNQVKAVSKLASNQNEIIGWIQDLEERFSLSLQVISGKISEEEFSIMLEDYYNEEGEDSDDEEDEDTKF
jgi:hypothetical protein